MNENEILEKLEQITNIAKEINNIDDEFGQLLGFCLKQVFEIYESKYTNKEYNISEFMDFVSKYLNFDFRKTQNYKADSSVVDFILGNSDVDNSNIDEYQKFLDDTLAKINKKVDE